MKGWNWFLMVGVVLVFCLTTTPGANAQTPTLDFWMTGPGGITEPYYAHPGEVFDIAVWRENTVSGLGGLSYTMEFNETLDLVREYSDCGWIANDGLWDSSNPGDGDSFNGPSIYFDTVHDPAGTEFPADTSGCVEIITITLSADPTLRWITFDLINPSASNGQGVDWELPSPNGLGGIINIGGVNIPDASLHTYGVHVPEPVTLSLLSLGLGFVVRRRKS